MPSHEAPCVELGSAPEQTIEPSPSPSEISSTSSPEPQSIQATPLFRMLAMPPPEPEQPPGQDELERRLPGYRRIVIPRELTLIELLKQSSGAITDEDVLRIREAKLRVIAERVGLRRLPVLAPRLRELTLDGSALPSLRDLGIGLVKLKFLSVNRCSLPSLDGAWGLGALRELHARGNALHDLQPLAPLQKLHTLDLSDNPISSTSRLWTLGVCGSLRRLALGGCPAASAPSHRALVATALPMLTHLDGRPLSEDDDDAEVFGAMSSSSDSEEEEPEDLEKTVAAETEPCRSTSKECLEPIPNSHRDTFLSPPCTSITFPNCPAATVCVGKRPTTTECVAERPRRRPATTECVGERPRPRLPPRPHTAGVRAEAGYTRLHFMNTLLDSEWVCGGSALTSQPPVCGNLARALRRSQRNTAPTEEKSEAEQTMAAATRSVAAEIPRAPILEDWARFREETGIDIQIDFNERPKGIDPNKAMDRLEEIERETMDRFNDMEKKHHKIASIEEKADEATPRGSDFYVDYEMWRQVEDLTRGPQGDFEGDSDLSDARTNDTKE